MIKRKAYSTDLTNEQWRHLRILLPKPQGKGRRRSNQQQRELLNAMLYINHTGCQWRDLPHDFPPWQTVYGYFEDLVEAGVWQEITAVLRRGVREQAGRDPEPSVVIVDSQSVKTTEKRAIVAGSMAAKRSKDANDISQLT
jgi:putative transposase